MKILTLLVTSILMLGMISAFYHNAEAEVSAEANANAEVNQYGENEEPYASGEAGTSSGMAVRNGIYIGPLGQPLYVNFLSSNLVELKSEGVSANTTLKLTAEGETNGRSKIYAHLSNGKKSEIKVMPNVASGIAMVELNVCSQENNCTIVLKETGRADNAKATYEVKGEKQMKILGLFRADADVRANIDAETGDVISVNEPWWAFMATEISVKN